MGWNRPNEESKANARRSLRRNQGLRPAVMLLIVGGLALCAGLVWRFRRAPQQADAKRDAETRQAQIREVGPSISTNVAKAVETNAVPKKKHPLKTYRDAKGVLRYEGGQVVLKPPVRTIDCRSDKKPIFNHVSEIAIQGLLEIEPGDFVVGSGGFGGRRFEQDFLESLKEPIAVGEKDSPEVAEMKQNVQDVKNELKARMDAGENLGQMLEDARAEMQRLGLYRDELRREVMRVLKDRAGKDDLTVADIDDCMKAANTMLSEKGLKPFSMPKKMFMRAIKSNQ